MVLKLETIRDATVALSKDRTKPLTVNVVLEQYNQLEASIAELSPSEMKDREPILRDLALLFSLAFMTTGYMQQPVSLYSKAFSLRSMLDLAVGELSITPKEDNSLKITLQSLLEGQEVKDNVEIKDIKYINEMLSNDIKLAQSELLFVRKQLQAIPESEQPLFIQVTHLRRDILAAAVSNEVDTTKAKFTNLKSKLDKIKTHCAQCNPQQPLSKTTEIQLKNAELFLEWFCHHITSEEFKEHMPELVEEFAVLKKMLPALNVLVLTRRWTLRSTDLYPYLSELVRIQPIILQKVGKSTTASQAGPTDFKQHTMSKYEYIVKYMLRRAWVEIFKMLDSCEPVSEALSSVYNQLLTMKRCLLEVQNAGGISNMRELYPFQMKLSSLDDLRIDGKFVVDGEVPAGQGVVISLLAECFDMVYEMKVELDERGFDDQDESLLVDDGDEEFSDGNDDDEVYDDSESTYTASIASSRI